MKKFKLYFYLYNEPFYFSWLVACVNVWSIEDLIKATTLASDYHQATTIPMYNYETSSCFFFFLSEKMFRRVSITQKRQQHTGGIQVSMNFHVESWHTQRVWLSSSSVLNTKKTY